MFGTVFESKWGTRKSRELILAINFALVIKQRFKLF